MEPEQGQEDVWAVLMSSMLLLLLFLLLLLLLLFLLRSGPRQGGAPSFAWRRHCQQTEVFQRDSIKDNISVQEQDDQTTVGLCVLG